MSNIITIETDIEPPLVAVAMGDWNALNRAYEVALARAEAAEAALAAAQARVRELELQLAGWDSLKLMAIERQEDVPWQAFLIEFREPTEAERAYGKTLISLLPAPPIDPPAPA